MLKIIKFSQPLVPTLVNSLESRYGNDLSTLCLILPTDRLGQYFTALYAEKVGSFLAPQITSWQRFLQDAYFKDYLSSDQIVLGNASAEILLRMLMEQGQYKHLRAGMEHELMQLLSDALASGWNTDQLTPALLAAAREDEFLSEDIIAYYHERFEEIESVVETLFLVAREKKLQFSRFLGFTALKNYCDQNRLPTLLPGCNYLIAGLTTLAPVQQQILNTLAELENFEIWITQAQATLPYAFNPLADIGKALLLNDDVLIERGHHKDSAEAPHYVVPCSSPIDEVELAQTCIEKFIGSGVCPSQIAIVVPSEKHYRQLLEGILSRTDIPYNFALALPFSHSFLGSFLASLVQLVHDPKDPYRIAAFLKHPLTQQFWPPDTELNPMKIWQEYVRAMEYGNIFTRIPVPKTERNCDPFFEEFPVFSLCLYLKDYLLFRKSQNLKEWLEILKIKILRPFKDSTYRESGKEGEKENSAVKEFESLLGELDQLSSVFDTSLDATAFFQIVADQLEKLEVRQKGYAFTGVQILSLDEARHIPFSYAIFLGMLEGILPKQLPRDELVDDMLKYKAGLRGWGYIEAIEETTFNLILGQCRQALLFYPENYGGTETTRSRYIEQLFIKGNATIVQQKEFYEYFHNFLVSEEKLSQFSRLEKQNTQLNMKFTPINAYQDEYAPYFSRMRVTHIERLIKCPFSFLLSSLKVEELTLPNKDDPRVIGIWLHRVLEELGHMLAVHKMMGSSQKDASSDDKLLTLKSPLEHFSKILQDLSERYRPPEFDDAWLLQHLRLYSWPKLAVFYHALAHFFGSDKLQDVQVERVIDAFPLFLGEQGQETCSISPRGKIDAIYIGRKEAFILDFKRMSIPKSQDILRGLEPQLLVYNSAIEDDLKGKNIYLGYYNIHAGEFKIISATHESGSREQASENDVKIPFHNDSLKFFATGALTKKFKELLAFRLNEAGKGMPLVVPDISRCDYCAFAGICGKNDPRFKMQYALENRLDKKFQRENCDKEDQDDGR